MASNTKKKWEAQIEGNVMQTLLESAETNKTGSRVVKLHETQPAQDDDSVDSAYGQRVVCMHSIFQDDSEDEEEAYVLQCNRPDSNATGDSEDEVKEAISEGDVLGGIRLLKIESRVYFQVFVIKGEL